MIRNLIIILTVSMLSGCATPALVTVDTPVPVSAKDSRDDGVLRDKDGRPVRHDLLGQSLPEFSAETIEGEAFASGDLAGKWTVLAAWGVWCHDSRNDAQHINELAQAVAANADIDFLSVHVPFSSEHTDIAYRDYGSVDGFFEAKGVAWPTIIDEQADIRELLEIKWTPTYLVVGPDLTVQAFRTDFSVEGDAAVATFLRDVKALIGAG